MGLVVLNELGRKAGAQIAAAVPEVDVVDVDGPTPPVGLRADVLFGGWSGEAQLRAWVEGTGVQWVQIGGTGVDKVPGWLFGDGRVVTCARGASAIPISEFVLATMLAFEKRLPEIWLAEPPETWNFARLGGLDGRTLVILGLGGIGEAVARRALPFGMRVIAVRRTASPSPVDGVELRTSLDDAVGEADHLVLAAPLTHRTRHIVDAALLERVRPGLHLVNIARGGLVDQDALRVALDDGRVAMASLDTMEPEPLPAGHWLYQHSRVRVSAHVSWASPAGLEAPVGILCENLRRRLAGEPLLHVVDPAEGY